VFTAVLSIFNKKILTHEHALEFSASRGVIMFFLCLFLIPFINLKLHWSVFILVYFTSLITTAGVLFYLKSLRHGEVSTIAPLMNMSPLFLLIIAFFILGEVPSPRQYFGVFLLVLGTYSLEVGVNNKGFFEPIRIFLKSKIIHFLFFAMIIFSITATLDKFIVSNYTNFLSYFFLLTIFKMINFVALETYQHGFGEIIGDLKKDFRLLTITAVFAFFGHIFYLLAVSIPGAAISLIIPIKRTSNLFTTIIGGKLFHEKNLLIKVLSCIIMLWGAVFILI